MATSYPTAVDTFTNPTGTQALSASTPAHSGQHSDLNDAVEAIESLVGITGAHNFMKRDVAMTASALHTFSAGINVTGGNLRVDAEDQIIAVDSGGSRRLGMVKKSATLPMFAMASDTDTVWRVSSATNIDASNTFTERMRLSTAGALSVSTSASAPNLSASGLTGATSASRYVGATASGAPTSGTFAIGDYVIARNGYMWICTVAGSPGTWVSSYTDAHGTLGYAQTTTAQTGIGTTVTDLTNLSIAVTVGTSRRIKVTGQLLMQQMSGSALIALAIREGTTTLQQSHVFNDATITGFVQHHAVAVLTPSSGAHTYKLSANTGANTVDTSPTSTRPAFILVEDIGAA